MLKKLFNKLNSNEVRKEDEYDLHLSQHLQETIDSVQNIVGESDDITLREFTIGNRISAGLFYIEGLSDEDTIEEDVLKPLIHLAEEKIKGSNTNDLPTIINEKVLSVISVSKHNSFDDALLPFMSGDALLVVDGVDKLITMDTRQYEKRGIEEPETEVLVRGPRDGFIEAIQTNISLLRTRIKDPNITVQLGEIGRRSKSQFAVIYMKGICKNDLVEEVRYRLACIETDIVPETGVLEQLMQDYVFTVFPQFLYTERPDKVVRALMDGKVIILLDGTPFALITPVTFQELLKSPEDYYENWFIGSLIRLLRYGAAFISIFLPALYIAVVSFHQGMIPTQLGLSIAAAREGVPFPSFVEAIIMEIALELLREAGVRLPRIVGSTIGIVGGLIIGEAAVRAGIVSPIMVIIVALTAISSFALPSYNVSIAFRIIRFIMMLAAATLGLYGMILVYICINIHLVGLRSFGSYYLSPFAPFHLLDWLDVVFRAPMSVMKSRPLEPKDKDHQKQV
ncbi:spore germination protein [Alteribacter populi]|uniref:spore germination protein n=1 Tax=Alteribacter populi TaxID=2011011 RepID=UPI000BBB1E59|nr:spore germination protein [Alteribacter populi]